MATRNAINVLIKLLGGPEMVAELEKLGKSGEKAFKSIETSANKVKLAQLGGSLSQFGSDIARTAKLATLAVSGLVAGVTAAAPAVIALANAGAKAADGVGKAAQATGLQTDAFQKFQFAAEQAGVSQEQFVSAMSRFGQEVVETANKTSAAAKKIGGSFSTANRDLTLGVGSLTERFEEAGVTVTRFSEDIDKASKKAAKGAKTTTSAFTQLGIKVKDAAGNLKSNEQLLLEVAKAFERMPDGARKSAIAVDLFGQAGARLIPFLNQGADGIRELMAEFERLGIGFTSDQIKAAQAYNDAIGSLARAARGLRLQIGLIFVPALTQAARAFRDVIVQNRAAILSFIDGAVKQAVIVVKDLILALTGADAGVENTWIIEWRDAIIQFGKDFIDVIDGVVIPAMGLLRDAAELTTDAINAIFNTDFSAGQVVILAGIIQLVGGFRLLQSAIFVVINAVALLTRAFTLNPILAVLSTVAAGIGLWATATDSATLALEAHRTAVGQLAAAYAKAGGEVAKITQSVRDRFFLEAQEALKKNEKAVSDAVDAIVNKLAQFDGALDRAADPVFELGKKLAAGEIDLLEFQAAIDRLGASNPQLANLANQIASITTEGRSAADATRELRDWVDLLTGNITDAEFQARKTGEAFRNIKPPADASKPLEDIGAAADGAGAKVEELGRKITVTRFGEKGMSKEVFDLVDGIARRSQTTTGALDQVGDSATRASDAAEAAAAEAAGVSDEITNSVGGAAAAAEGASDKITDSISNAVPPDAATPGVDSVISDVERITPAAQQVAADASAALGEIGTLDGAGAQQAAQAILQPFLDLQQRIATIFNGIRQVAQNGFQSIAALVRQLASQIQSEINRIISALQRAAAAAAKLRSQASGSSGRDESGGPGLAGGGPVLGKGGPRSDSNLRWLSNGEFVVQAAAVRKLGLRALYAINRGMLPNLSRIKGMADGGLVSSMLSDFNSRFDFAPAVGSVSVARSSNSRPLTLVLPDGNVVTGMTADDNAVKQMQKFSLMSTTLSAGRKPGRGK